MPEQITKYPDVTMRVLEGAGGVCAEGAEQRILTECPPERFCSLPSGEICVYGIEDIPAMTQIRVEELARVVCPRAQEGATAALTWLDGLLFAGLLLVGFVAGTTRGSGRPGGRESARPR